MSRRSRRKAKAAKKLGMNTAQPVAKKAEIMTVKMVKKYLSIGKLLSPILIPAFFKLVSSTRSLTEQPSGRKPLFALKSATKTSSRIFNLYNSLNTFISNHPTDVVDSKYISDTKSTLNELNSKLKAVENMNAASRGQALDSINSQLDSLESEYIKRLGL